MITNHVEIELAVDDGASDFVATFGEAESFDEWWNICASILKRLWQEESPDRGGLIGIVLTGDDRMREINRDFRGKDRATDVLSFDLSDESDKVEGEVYIGVDRAAAQARDIGCTDAEELARLVIHGVLHLAGHDHHDPDEERRMLAATERWIDEWMRSRP